jgi:hypothetical protein
VPLLHVVAIAIQAADGGPNHQPWWPDQHGMLTMLYNTRNTPSHGGQMLLLKDGIATDCPLFQLPVADTTTQNHALLVALAATAGRRGSDQPPAGDHLHCLEHLEGKVP